jgi:hypothetical protein
MPISPSLSPFHGERVAEGRERGISTNPLIIIGNWYESVQVRASGLNGT